MITQTCRAIERLSKRNVNVFIYMTRNNFSRRSVNTEGPFIVKSRKTEKEDTHLAWRNPNFDLLASQNFPFFMRGNIGPAWYDTYTTIQNDGIFVMQQLQNEENANIICRAQTCPQVLRKTVIDLFPHRNLEEAELSVITISLKPNLKDMRKNNELETEKLAQTFVITAKNVCNKLRKSSYWADFINPFSGRPYFASTNPASNQLYDTDERFRCLDFQIFEIDKCTIISNEQDNTKKKFIGSLFTNAPAQKGRLDEIFTK